MNSQKLLRAACILNKLKMHKLIQHGNCENDLPANCCICAIVEGTKGCICASFTYTKVVFAWVLPAPRVEFAQVFPAPSVVFSQILPAPRVVFFSGVASTKDFNCISFAITMSSFSSVFAGVKGCMYSVHRWHLGLCCRHHGLYLRRCCRHHDLGCPLSISPGQSKGGVTNHRPAAAFHCDCDRRSHLYADTNSLWEPIRRRICYN